MTSTEYRELAKEARSEHQEQVEVVKYLRRNKILHFAVPNGGHRHKKTARDLKEEGVVAGVPDLVITEPNNYYHGLFIEMKRRPKTLKNGEKSFIGINVSDNQQTMMQELRHRNYECVVCYGADEAIEAIESYVGNIER